MGVCVCVRLDLCLCVQLRDVQLALRGVTQKSIIAPKHINASDTSAFQYFGFLLDIFINSKYDRPDSLSMGRGYLK